MAAAMAAAMATRHAGAHFLTVADIATCAGTAGGGETAAMMDGTCFGVDIFITVRSKRGATGSREGNDGKKWRVQTRGVDEVKGVWFSDRSS